MAFIKEIKCNEGVIGIWELTESSDELSKTFIFSDDEASQYNILKLEKRKKEFLAVRLLLKHLLKERMELFYGENGNPHLKNNPLNISISHSAELVTIFLSSKNCGIDTENINRDTTKIAKRYLSEAELKTILKNSDPALARLIFWSAKEAIYKCAKEKEVLFNTHIMIEPFPIEHSGNFSGKMVNRSNQFRFFNLQYLLFGNNVIVYCVEELKS